MELVKLVAHDLYFWKITIELYLSFYFRKAYADFSRCSPGLRFRNGNILKNMPMFTAYSTIWIVKTPNSNVTIGTSLVSGKLREKLGKLDCVD
jgi:hypothetical protein